VRLTSEWEGVITKLNMIRCGRYPKWALERSCPDDCEVRVEPRLQPQPQTQALRPPLPEHNTVSLYTVCSYVNEVYGPLIPTTSGALWERVMSLIPGNASRRAALITRPERINDAAGALLIADYQGLVTAADLAKIGMKAERARFAARRLSERYDVETLRLIFGLRDRLDIPWKVEEAAVKEGAALMDARRGA